MSSGRSENAKAPIDSNAAFCEMKLRETGGLGVTIILNLGGDKKQTHFCHLHDGSGIASPSTSIKRVSRTRLALAQVAIRSKIFAVVYAAHTKSHGTSLPLYPV